MNDRITKLLHRSLRNAVRTLNASLFNDKPLNQGIQGRRLSNLTKTAGSRMTFGHLSRLRYFFARRIQRPPALITEFADYRPTLTDTAVSIARNILKSQYQYYTGSMLHEEGYHSTAG